MIKYNSVPEIGACIFITWVDAWFMPYESMKMDGLKTYLVGFIVDKNKHGVKISVECNEEGDYRHFHFIPIGMIKSIEVLKPPMEFS